MDKLKNIRIIITGPESSGKTTLVNALSEHYNVEAVPELARAYIQKLDRAYTLEDLTTIAQAQFDLIHGAPSPIQICDTGFVVMKIWALEIYDHVPELIDHLLEDTQVDLYVLCVPDIPWEDDPLRENPADRDRLFNRYLTQLLNYEADFIIVQGSPTDRLNDAIAAIDEIYPKAV